MAGLTLKGAALAMVLGAIFGYTLFHFIVFVRTSRKDLDSLRPTPPTTKPEPKVIGPEAPEGFRKPWAEGDPTNSADTSRYQLCGTCQQIDLGLLGLELRSMSRDSSQSVRLGRGLGGVRSGRELCDLCDLIWRSLFDDDPIHPRIKESDFPDYITVTLSLDTFAGISLSHLHSSHMLQRQGSQHTSVTNMISVQIQSPFATCCPGDVRFLKKGKIMIYRRSDQLPDADDLCPALREQPLPPANSDKTFATIDSWFQGCLRDHPACRTTRLNKARTCEPPPRLIEIPVDAGHVRLIEATDVQEPYAALSYCWGNFNSLSDSEQANPATTTSTTFKEFQIQIPLDAIPLTIQHAIYITRRLGIKYLWVDSMCIVQDDPVDWQNHTVLMGSIYANALVTIAATGAANSSEGCFLSNPIAEGGSDSLYKHEAKLPIVISGRYIGGMFAAPLSMRRNLNGLEGLGAELAVSCWKDRAWVLQERFFSRRVVHFGASQVHWECEQMVASQMRPFAELQWRAASTKKPVLNVERWWCRLLSQYTSSELSVDGDRLPAIASIAKEIAEAHKLTYVAGVYAEMLPRCLVWAAATNSRPGDDWARLWNNCLKIKPLTHPYVCPGERVSSWSWAHWEGSIATLNTHSYDPFLSHMGGIKVVERGDEHSHHQSSLVLWSQIRRVTRSQRRMETSDIQAHDFTTHNIMNSYQWPTASVCYAILRDDPEGSGGTGSEGFVVFDDPENAAPMEFDLVPVGSSYGTSYGTSSLSWSRFRCVDISLAVKRVGNDEISAADMKEARALGVEGGAALLPDRYRRLGLVVHSSGGTIHKPGPFTWEPLACNAAISFVRLLEPFANGLMTWFPFGFFKRFHSYRQICLI